MPVISILIPTIPAHFPLFGELAIQLLKQTANNSIEVLIDERTGVSTGAKRNSLLERSTGAYTCYIDSDDMIAATYVQDIIEAINIHGTDAICFNGYMTTNGTNKKQFRISKEYGYEEKNNIYFRWPNHLIPMRREITTAFKFEDKSYGEDYAWSLLIRESGMVKTEYVIEKELYHYKYVNFNKSYKR